MPVEHTIMSINKVVLIGEKTSNFATFVAVEKSRYDTFLPNLTSDNLIERQAGNNLRNSRPKRSVYFVPVRI